MNETVPTKAEIEERLATVHRLKEEAQEHIDKGDGAHWEALYRIQCEAEEALQFLLERPGTAKEKG